MVKPVQVAEYGSLCRIISGRNPPSTCTLRKYRYNAGMASARDTLQARQELVSAVTEERRLKEVYSIYNLSDESRYEIKSPITGFVAEKHVNKDTMAQVGCAAGLPGTAGNQGRIVLFGGVKDARFRWKR